MTIPIGSPAHHVPGISETLVVLGGTISGVTGSSGSNNLQQVPVTNAPNQKFTASLQVDVSTLYLNLAIRYNEMAGYWVMDISDSNNNLLVASTPLITGLWPAGNLLQQQAYLRIGSAYIVNVSNKVPIGTKGLGYGEGGYGEGPYGGIPGFAGVDYPDNTNLGTDFQLWWGDTPTR